MDKFLQYIKPKVNKKKTSFLVKWEEIQKAKLKQAQKFHEFILKKKSFFFLRIIVSKKNERENTCDDVLIK